LARKLRNAVFVNKLIRAAAAAAAARSRNVGATVQNDLNGGQKVGLFALGMEFPPVGQRRHGAVGPARAAVSEGVRRINTRKTVSKLGMGNILRDVLIEIFGAVVDAADVAPIEGVGGWSEGFGRLDDAADM
jgi:hypothetical protein